MVSSSLRTMTSGEEPMKRQIVQFEKKKIRRGINETQRPVEINGIGAAICLKALREHHLNDISRDYIFLGFLNGGFCIVPASYWIQSLLHFPWQMLFYETPPQ